MNRWLMSTTLVVAVLASIGCARQHAQTLATDLLRLTQSYEAERAAKAEAETKYYREQLRILRSALGGSNVSAGAAGDAPITTGLPIEQSIAYGRIVTSATREAYLLAEDVEEADRLAQQALANSRHRKMRGNEARALWLLGEIAMRRDPPDVAQAEAHYQQALTLAEELDMRPLQAHCHNGLGRLYHHTSRATQARVALAAATDLYRAMDMTLWLPQAEVVLAQVEGQP